MIRLHGGIFAPKAAWLVRILIYFPNVRMNLYNCISYTRNDINTNSYMPNY